MDLIDEILDNVKTIAVVGLSDNRGSTQLWRHRLHAVAGVPDHPGEPGAEGRDGAGRAVLRRSGVGAGSGAG